MGNTKSGLSKNGKFKFESGRTEAEEIKYQSSLVKKKFPEHSLNYEVLRTQILYEYPFISSVRNSLLVSDNRLPDCPIVFCSDAFERLTLYPKEFALGRNCRFLQGRLTDRRVVAKLSEALRAGERCDVELLNYRQDGAPFWNVFSVLPVHAQGKKTGPVEFFLALQKDGSLLVKLPENVSAWSSTEVALWMDRSKLDSLAAYAVQQEVSGSAILTLLSGFTPPPLANLSSVEIDAIRQAASRDISNGLYSNGAKVAPIDFAPSTESDLSETPSLSEPSLQHALASTSLVSRQLESQKILNPEEFQNVPAAASPKLPGHGRISVKLFWGPANRRDVILVSRETSLSGFFGILRRRYGDECDITLVQNGNHACRLDSSNASEWSKLLNEASDSGFSLRLIPRQTPLPAAQAMLLNAVATPVIVISGFEQTLFINSAARRALNFSPDAPCPDPLVIFGSDLDLSLTAGLFLNCAMHLPSEVLIASIVTVQSAPNGLRVMTLEGIRPAISSPRE